MTKDEALKLALEAFEEIALAGMSPAPEMIDSKEAFHARQAWRFIGVAARALDPIKEALAQPEQHQDWCASLTQMLTSMPPKPAPCNCKPAQPEQEPSELDVWKSRALQAEAVIEKFMAQPKQEPVAWETFALKFANGKGLSYEKPKNLPKYLACRPLIYQPAPTPVIDKSAAIRIATSLGWEPKRAWVGLSDEELAEFSEAKLGAYDLCLEVEAKLKEKNNG